MNTAINFMGFNKGVFHNAKLMAQYAPKRPMNTYSSSPQQFDKSQSTAIFQMQWMRQPKMQHAQQSNFQPRKGRWNSVLKFR
mmetsp:Transcript_30616/g.40121  ORF Transcript_30616/g.40121 Transcript_30616/m.40121 type:complete len:82 (-) Transcript_30616:34-279(-)